MWMRAHRYATRDLARLLGVSHASVAGWASGRTLPSPAHSAALETLSGGHVHACCLRGVGHHG